MTFLSLKFVGLKESFIKLRRFWYFINELKFKKNVILKIRETWRLRMLFDY